METVPIATGAREAIPLWSRESCDGVKMRYKWSYCLVDLIPLAHFIFYLSFSMSVAQIDRVKMENKRQRINEIGM